MTTPEIVMIAILGVIGIATLHFLFFNRWTRDFLKKPY